MDCVRGRDVTHLGVSHGGDPYRREGENREHGAAIILNSTSEMSLMERGHPGMSRGLLVQRFFFILKRTR